MTMPAPVVQSDAGDVDGANAYIDVAFFKTYHTARGNSFAGKTDDQIGTAIVRATDYVDGRFNFRGIKLLTTQTTQFPRQAGSTAVITWWDVSFSDPTIIAEAPGGFVALVDSNNVPIVGIVVPLKNATAEYALRALSAPLFRDAPAPPGGRLIRAETIKVDVIESSTEYEPGQSGAFVMPAYPTADMMLVRAGLIEVGRTLYR